MADTNTQRTLELQLLNARLKAIVEEKTADKPVRVQGTVRRVYQSDKGHTYFTLSDRNFSIDCIVRTEKRRSIGFTLRNNTEVEVFGPVAVYDRKAQLQIDVTEIRLMDRPVLRDHQEVVAYLEQRGLWPPPRRELPSTIQRIAIVTSEKSKALSDFESQYRIAGGTAQIQLVAVRVQGQHAAQEIADAIQRLNLEAEADVIVLTRGGGRDAELAVFDDALIAEAICRSAIPIVTGIGHQRDESVADQIADLNAGTPTAAAYRLAGELAEDERGAWWLWLLLGVGFVTILILVVLILTA